MTLNTALSRLAVLEDRLSQLYAWLGTSLSNDPEVAGVFASLSLQESAHRNLLEYQRRLLRDSDLVSGRLEIDEQEIDRLSTMIDDFRDRKSKPTVAEALDLAMTIESSAAENLHGKSIGEVEPEVAKVIRTLAGDDRKHFVLLEKLNTHVKRLRWLAPLVSAEGR